MYYNYAKQSGENVYRSSVLSTNGINESSGLRMIFEKNMPENVIVESAQGMKQTRGSQCFENEKKLFTFQK